MFELRPYRNNNHMTTYDPFRDMEALERAFFGNRDFLGDVGTFKTDIQDKGDSYLLEADLPGFKKEELQIELKDGYLTVSGSKEVSSTEEPKENQKDAKTTESDASKKDDKAEQKPVKYIRQERYSGNVSRSFYVGENLEEKDIHAKFENGTLTLTFPKELKKKAAEEKHFVSIEG